VSRVRRLLDEMTHRAFESEPMAERQVAGHFMAGTLVSLRGQAALGNRFPKRFGNSLPDDFPTERRR